MEGVVEQMALLYFLPVVGVVKGEADRTQAASWYHGKGEGASWLCCVPCEPQLTTKDEFRVRRSQSRDRLVTHTYSSIQLLDHSRARLTSGRLGGQGSDWPAPKLPACSVCPGRFLSLTLDVSPKPNDRAAWQMHFQVDYGRCADGRRHWHAAMQWQGCDRRESLSVWIDTRRCCVSEKMRFNCSVSSSWLPDCLAVGRSFLIRKSTSTLEIAPLKPPAHHRLSINRIYLGKDTR